VPPSNTDLRTRPRVEEVVTDALEVPITQPVRPNKTSAPIDGFQILILIAILLLGAFLRLWRIDAHGYNSDEAVYAGQAAAIAEQTGYKGIFPVFRAHPMLFQYLLGIVFKFGVIDLVGRLVAVIISLITIYLVSETGRILYGRSSGLWAAAFVAVMPYHVVVSRQVLLDGPMTLCATAALYMMVRFSISHDPRWFYAASCMMGLVFLAKEGGVVLVAAGYLFLAVTRIVRLRFKQVMISLACMLIVIAGYPLSLALGGGVEKAQASFVWQLFRRANHEPSFYLTTVPRAVGPALLLIAALGLVFLWRRNTWRELLILCWIAMPVTFFQLWPVKGWQYLLPAAPAVALLAGRTVTRLGSLDKDKERRRRLRWMRVALGLCVAATLLVPAWGSINAVVGDRFLAGSGGVPAGREAGEWIAANVPEGAQLMTIGPSMANIVKFYGNRNAWGLSVSPNPLHRNPSYLPIANPDRQLRTGHIQYLVWDAYSADRSTFFSEGLLRYTKRYNGIAIHTETVDVASSDGRTTAKPVIIVYEVRPSG
jgi:hypothetical protein